MKVWGMKPGDIRMVEMAPPDVSGALAAGAIDGFVMGEPFPSQAEMGGFGRILFQARDYWPDYMSCILVVRQDLIDKRPETVQVLVDGIARSGLWLDKGKPYREDAADFVDVTTTTRNRRCSVGLSRSRWTGSLHTACSAQRPISIWSAT